jgi:hypothetical protein
MRRPAQFFQAFRYILNRDLMATFQGRSLARHRIDVVSRRVGTGEAAGLS